MNRPTHTVHHLLESGKNMPFPAARKKKKIRRLEYFNKETIWGSRSGLVLCGVCLLIYFMLQEWASFPKGNFYTVTAVATLSFLLGWRIGTQRLSQYYEVNNR